MKLLKFFSVAVFVSLFLVPHLSFATTWNTIVDDTFARSDTSTGAAGSTTGVGNSWVDVAGGIWNLGSGRLQGTSSSSSDYLTKFLVRPSGENAQDQREIITIPAGENFGQYLGVVLRYQSGSQNHYLAHISASGIYLYKIVGGATTLISSNPVSISNTDSYTVDFSATGVSSTDLSVTVTDVTSSSLVGTITTTDSEATLQTSGSMGVSTWYNSGTHTIHATRIQTFAPSTTLMLIGNSTAAGSVSVATPITTLQITGTSGSTVPVKLFVTSGTLAMSTTTGLTFTGSPTGSTLYFSGTVANINNALATLTYTRGSAGSDTLEASLVNPGEVFFTDNGHLYEFVTSTQTWNAAHTAAALLTKYGATGYLATITSAAENAFISARMNADGWIGASDVAVEGDWKWVTGPETGTSFWSGASGGSTVGGQYANWNSGEPNDSSSNEDCAEYYSGSSKWNDLPCSGSTLSGYVVEYGSATNAATVAAKNIAITTSTNPTVSSVSPLDDATGVTTSSNLVIHFSTSVIVGTGNILIKKTSDDSTVESIDVTSGQVTGGGTSTITLDPAITFSDSTGYYIIIPGTAFQDGSSNFYAGIASNTTWNFTTGDFTAPLISAVTVAPLQTTATITWTTNENASSLMAYGLTNALGTSTSETDTSPRVTSHTIMLSGLTRCKTYYYTVTSTDAATNTATTSTSTFRTKSCAVTQPVFSSTPTTTPDTTTPSTTTDTPSEPVPPVTVSIPEPTPPPAPVDIPVATISTPISGVPYGFRFTVDMRLGQSSSDISKLQQFLKEQGPDIYPRGLVTGFFGPLTKKAVEKFQEKYSSDILSPINLPGSTGFASIYTRAKINSMLAAQEQ